MAVPSNRDILRLLAVAGGALAGAWVAWQLRQIVLGIVLAVLLAIAIDPAVRLLERRLRLGRAWAIGLTCAGIGGLLALALWIFIPPLVDAVGAAVDAAPGYVERLQDEAWVRELDERFQVIDRLEAAASDLPETLGGPDAAVGAAQSVFSGVIAVLSVLIMTVFMLVYGPRLRAFALAQLTEPRRGQLAHLADRSHRVVAGYIVGNLVVSLIAGAASWIMFAAAGVPFAPALALWVALTDLVPLIGATLGALVCVPVALFQGPATGIAVIVFFVVYQQVENHLIQPLVMRRTIAMNPLVTLVAVLAGAKLLGVIGALMAIPVAGVAQLMVMDALAARRRRLGLEEASDTTPAGARSAGEAQA